MLPNNDHLKIYLSDSQNPSSLGVLLGRELDALLGHPDEPLLHLRELEHQLVGQSAPQEAEEQAHLPGLLGETLQGPRRLDPEFVADLVEFLVVDLDQLGPGGLGLGRGHAQVGLGAKVEENAGRSGELPIEENAGVLEGDSLSKIP